MFDDECKGVLAVFWRVIGFIGGLTFVAGGLDVLLTPECGDVDFGGSRRSSTYACVPTGSGDVNAGLAGAGMLVLGVAMMMLATWPLWAAMIERRRANRAWAALTKQQQVERTEAVSALFSSQSRTAAASTPTPPAASASAASTGSATDEDWDREILYSTAEWSRAQLDEVRTELADRGISFHMEQGDLVVDKTVSAVVDRILDDLGLFG